MAITNYTELQTAIVNWTKRTEGITARANEFIALAEADFNRKLRTRDMESVATVTASAATYPLSALSSTYLEHRTFWLDLATDRPLEYVTPDVFHAKYLGVDTGKPVAYTIEGNVLRFGPAPDSTYTGQFLYVGAVPALSTASATNFLLTAAPDVYLYGSLVQAAAYFNDDNRLPIWETFYERAIDEYQRSQNRGRYSSGSLMPRTRSRPA